MIGDHEPYGELWRLGADEATTIQTEVARKLGDLGKFSSARTPIPAR
jgi:hypothetical protein